MSSYKTDNDLGLYRLVKELEAITLSTENSLNEGFIESTLDILRDSMYSYESFLQETEEEFAASGENRSVGTEDIKRLAEKVAHLTSEKHQLQQKLSVITEDRTRILIHCFQSVQRCHQHFKKCFILRDKKYSTKRGNTRDNSTQCDFEDKLLIDLQKIQINNLEKKIVELKEEKKEAAWKVLLLRQMLVDLETKLSKAKKEAEIYRWATKKEELAEKFKRDTYELGIKMNTESQMIQDHVTRKTRSADAEKKAIQVQCAFGSLPATPKMHSFLPKAETQYSCATPKSIKSCRSPKTYELLFKLRFLQKTLDDEVSGD